LTGHEPGAGWYGSITWCWACVVSRPGGVRAREPRRRGHRRRGDWVVGTHTGVYEGNEGFRFGVTPLTVCLVLGGTRGRAFPRSLDWLW
jgi:hypothetical protein